MTPPQIHLLFWEILPLTEWTHRNLRAPYWRLYWNNKEGASIRSRRDHIPLRPDHVILIPPETPFASFIKNEVIHFYVHFLTSRRWSLPRPFVMPLSPAERHTWETFALQITRKEERPNAFTWQVCSLTCSYLSRLPESEWEPSPDPGERIRTALLLIDRQIPANIPVSQLARKVGMNINAFIRLFREKVGVTPARYAMQRRIENACQLLHHSSQSIDEIAANCGFCDRYHFTKVFTRNRGISPAAFRQQIQRKQLQAESKSLKKQ